MKNLFLDISSSVLREPSEKSLGFLFLSKGKKRKLVTETSDKPSPARRSKPGLVTKRRKPTSSMRSVDESVAECIPEKEPRFDDEETDVQRALEESLKSIYDTPRGPLPPVVIREPESGKYQPLPEVQGKGKEKVTNEQVTLDLITLQTPKKKSPAHQFIFQRRTSTPIGSFGHDESSSLYDELGLTNSEVESNKDVPGIDAGVPDEGQAGPNPRDDAVSQPLPSHVVHAGPNLEHMDLKATDVSTQPHPEQMDEGNLLALQGPCLPYNTCLKDLSFGDIFFNDKPSKADNEKKTAETEAESMVSITIQQDTSTIPPMTTPVIDLTSIPESPNVHRPLQVMATETTTTTTTIHPPPPQPQQSNTDSILKKRIGELEHIMANLIQDNKHLEERLDSHGARLYTLENLDIHQQVRKAMDEIVTDAVDWAIQASLQNRFRDLPEADMKEILHQRMWETNSYKTHEDHMMRYEALEKSMKCDHSEELLKVLAEASKKKKKRRSPRASGPSQVSPPPPLPPSTNQEGQSHGFAAPSSSKTAASAEYKAWTTTDTRLRPSVSSTPEDLQMDDDDMALDAQVHSSDDEDNGNAHIPKVNLRQDWWKPLEEDRLATLEPTWSISSSDMHVSKNNWTSAFASTYSPPPEDSLLAQTGDMAMFMDCICKRQGITELKPQDLEGPAFELIKVFHPNVIHLQYQMEECHKLLTDSLDDSIIRHNVSKPLPLGGPPGQVIIQYDFFFNKDLEYLRYGSKDNRPALSISKMNVTYYPDVGLEQMVPDQMWIEEECKHTSEGDCRAVRTHTRILSVVRIKVFSMYRYDYIKKIVLRKADLNEHIIVERDFKYMYPSDFEDLHLLNLQGHLNHLPPKDKKILTTAAKLWIRHLVIKQRIEDFQLGIERYQTQLNLTKPRWDATGFEYKHDYMVIDSLRAVTFRDRYGVQMIMRFNEIYKFSDGTLYQIDEVLDYRVKEFKVNRMNLGLNTRFWTRKDVDRSKEFMFAIQKWLKTRRMFRNLKSFVGGRVRDGEYRLLKRTE
nr:hypothetical protein [Tanacetum cinerariifolium]